MNYDALFAAIRLTGYVTRNQVDELAKLVLATPIDMVLHCPACGVQHIDAPEGERHLTVARVDEDFAEPEAWANPPHRSHLCHDCKHVWRPADVPTNGVLAVKTKGKNDSPIRAPLPALLPELERCAFCGGRFERPCERAPVDTCEQALEKLL